MHGGIDTSYKAHWDSQKEYEKFWSKGRSTNRLNKQKKKKRKWPVVLLLVLICAVIVVSVWFVTQKEKASLNERSVLNSEASESIVNIDPDSISEYAGDDVIELNGGIPCFTDYDLENITGETFSELDSLGRCGTAVAMLDRTMMPTEERSSIGNVRPSGWVQEKYPGIIDSDPPYLYNRSHLIAYAMTGQNANELNLITGTRYMNAKTMLPYEEQVLRYLDNSDNHVLYRVSPYFKESELVARGVEIEAYSVEDSGDGVCFHVFLYNIQPGIGIDYRTGNSWIEN